MTTVYFAFDGTEFRDKNECLDYEKELREKYSYEGKNYLMMYNRRGVLTEDPDEAYVVHIMTSADSFDDLEKGACYFIQLCKDYDASYEGIDEESFGWYYWNECSDSYLWMDDDLVGTIYSAVKNEGGLA